MADIRAVAARVPVSYVNATGTQVFVDVSLLYSEDGELKIDAAYAYGSDFLRSLFKAGLIYPISAPKAAAAILFSAVDWGAGTNNTRVIVAANADPTKFDVKVSRADSYPNIRVADLASLLGTAGRQGTKPGLVRLKTASTKLPKDLVPAPLAGGTATVASFLELDADGGGKSFTLEAKGLSAAGDLTTVEIKNADPVAGTFTLVARWEKEVTGVTVATAATDLAALNYLVEAQAPSGGFRMPAAAVYPLSGGMDAPLAAVTLAAKVA